MTALAAALAMLAAVAELPPAVRAILAAPFLLFGAGLAYVPLLGLAAGPGRIALVPATGLTATLLVAEGLALAAAFSPRTGLALLVAGCIPGVVVQGLRPTTRAGPSPPSA